MLASLALASSLWLAASEAGARPEAAQAVQTSTVAVLKAGKPLAVDLAFIGGGFSWDLGTTRWAIDRGCREGNPIPLMQEVEGRVALKLAQTTFRATVAYILRSRGHDRAANVFRYAGAVTDGAIGISNIACGLKGRA